AGPVTNTASVSGSPTDPNTANSSASASTTVSGTTSVHDLVEELLAEVQAAPIPTGVKMPLVNFLEQLLDRLGPDQQFAAAAPTLFGAKTPWANLLRRVVDRVKHDDVPWRACERLDKFVITVQLDVDLSRLSADLGRKWTAEAAVIGQQLGCDDPDRL